MCKNILIINHTTLVTSLPCELVNAYVDYASWSTNVCFLWERLVQKIKKNTMHMICHVSSPMRNAVASLSNASSIFDVVLVIIDPPRHILTNICSFGFNLSKNYGTRSSHPNEDEDIQQEGIVTAHVPIHRIIQCIKNRTGPGVGTGRLGSYMGRLSKTWELNLNRM